MAATVPPFLFAQAGTFTAPFQYEVPASGEVQPYTASATYTNASGQAILPALRLKSASGNLLALTFPVGQTIADGSASEVTFVPPFGSASGSSTPSGASLTHAIYNGTGTTGTTQHWSSVTTDDPTTFSVDGSDDTLAVVSSDGFYLVVLTASVAVLTSPYTIPNNHAANCVETTGGADVVKLVLVIRNQTAGTLPASGSEYYSSVAIWPYFSTAAPWKFRVSLTNADANVAVAGRLRFVKLT